MSAGMLTMALRKDDGPNPHLYPTPPPQLADHPLFSGTKNVGLVTADKPRFPVAVGGGNDALEATLRKWGLQHERTHGSYGGKENSYLVYNPTLEQMHHLGHAFGQEAVVYSHGGKHDLLYTHGPNDGKYHPSFEGVHFYGEQAPEDYYTHLPGRGYFSLNFDFSQLHPSASKFRPPQAKTTAERQAFTVAKDEVAPGMKRRRRTVGHGLLWTPEEYAEELRRSPHLRKSAVDFVAPSSALPRHTPGTAGISGALPQLFVPTEPAIFTPAPPETIVSEKKSYTPREVCNELAKAIQEKVTAYAAGFEQLRKRELKQAGKRLRKADLNMCPTCGNPDAPGSCSCVPLQKNAAMGYGGPPKTPGMQPATAANPVPGSHGMGKAEMCKACGKPHPLGKCMGKGEKDPRDTADKMKDLFEGPEPKVLHPSDKKKPPAKKLGKDELEKGVKRAAATAGVLAAVSGAQALDRYAHTDKPLPGVIHPAPFPPEVGEPHPHSNKRPAGATSPPGRAPMRRPEEFKRGEKGPGLKKEADLWDPKGNDAGKVRGSVLARQGGATAAAPPVKRSPKDIRGVKPEQMKGPVQPLVHKDEKAPGAKLPPASPKVAEASKGSGGQVKKGKKLSKAVNPALRTTMTGLGGVPAGLGALPASAPRRTLPLGDLASLVNPAGKSATKRMPSPALPGLVAPTHPETTAALSDVRALRDNPPYAARKAPATSVAQGNQELAGFKSIAANPTAMPGGQLVTPKGPAGVPSSARAGADLANDKRSAGVGFVNSLMARIRGAGNKTWEGLQGAGGPKPGLARTAAAAGALARSEQTGEGEPLDKAWRAGGPRPTTGPMAPAPTQETPPASPTPAAPPQTVPCFTHGYDDCPACQWQCALCGGPEHLGNCS